ncbi:MAG: Arc family DNA binding domain-containing protein [Bacteroidetes bacterium GWA2_31_9b]|nr:MAG: Arc family DNA binding domain-containing protein [Bacteroidetes bacterium GWA2_31_9b]
MALKKSFVLRLDPDKLKAIEKWAADEFRSTNGQLEWIITKALKESGRLKKTEALNEDENENVGDS